MRRAVLGSLSALTLLLPLVSCSTVRYYGQAVRGHLEVVRLARPIDAVLAAEDVDAELSGKLRHVREVVAFADKELGLDADRSYARYADLGREHVVWNVFAAPEFSLRAKTWWYPVVGSLSYRGFYDENSAQALGSELRAEGLDVMVAGIDAYSTLGWFSDPVLNTFVDRSELGLVLLLCHELAHRRLFFPGDTDLSEAFATTIEEEALARWSRSRELPPSKLARYRTKSAVLDRIRDDMAKARAELEGLYRQLGDLGDEEVRRRKTSLLEELKARSLARIRPHSKEAAERFAKLPMNNARLTASRAYHGLVPELQRLLRDECQGDLEAFYRAVEELGRERRADRRAKKRSENITDRP